MYCRRLADSRLNTTDGVPVKRLIGMIYWYGWGSMKFDIRVVREILHLPKTHPADNWFNSETPDPTGSFERIITQLHKALQSSGLRFYDVLMQHDTKIFEDALLDNVKFPNVKELEA